MNNSAASKDLKISLSEEKQFEDVQHYLTAPPLAEIPKVFRRQRFVAIITRPHTRGVHEENVELIQINGVFVRGWSVHEEQVSTGAAKTNDAQAAEGAACSH